MQRASANSRTRWFRVVACSLSAERLLCCMFRRGGYYAVSRNQQELIARKKERNQMILANSYWPKPTTVDNVVADGCTEPGVVGGNRMDSWNLDDVTACWIERIFYTWCDCVCIRPVAMLGFVASEGFWKLLRRCQRVVFPRDVIGDRLVNPSAASIQKEVDRRSARYQ
ncbi:hypothetical protein BT63DRAFT_136355 [Microthyrium microscopicum]|uniref:Uncharacterized protein n=1 Tax=Microthyrium microscopicum TaxID=703497 RepID=A0A6A6UM61_9PEZI|nr:hypothetical protein BT63DRAFT_136355 [Microthyrium microscopicum]